MSIFLPSKRGKQKDARERRNRAANSRIPLSGSNRANRDNSRQRSNTRRNQGNDNGSQNQHSNNNNSSSNNNNSFSSKDARNVPLQQQSNPKHINKSQNRRTIKLRTKTNRYGQIQDSFAPSEKAALSSCLKKGRSEIEKWRRSQVEDLSIPHLGPSVLFDIQAKLNINMSDLFYNLQKNLSNELTHSVQQCKKGPLSSHASGSGKSSDAQGGGNKLNKSKSTNNNSDSKNKNKNSSSNNSNSNAEANEDFQKLDSLLRQSWRFVRIDEFFALNRAILTQMQGGIPPEIIRILAEDKNQDLLEAMGVNIQRQVWEHQPKLFDPKITEFVKNYALDAMNPNEPSNSKNDRKKDQNESKMNANNGGDSGGPKEEFDALKTPDHVFVTTLQRLGTSPKFRRANNNALKKIVELIGASRMLYERTVEHIRRSFVDETDNFLDSLLRVKKVRDRSDWKLVTGVLKSAGVAEHVLRFCNLRMDLAMSVAEHARDTSRECDKVWDFIEWINNGINDTRLELTKIDEILQYFNNLTKTYDGVEAENSYEREDHHNVSRSELDNVILDIGMILALPAVKSLLCNTYRHLINDIVHRKITPRHNKNVGTLCQMLQICDTHVWFYRRKRYKHILPAVNHMFLHHFSPYFTVAICADMQLTDLTLVPDIPEMMEQEREEMLETLTASDEFDTNDDLTQALEEKMWPRMCDLFQRKIGCLDGRIQHSLQENGSCLFVLLSYFIMCLHKYRFDRCREMMNLFHRLKPSNFVSCVNELYSIKYAYMNKYDCSDAARISGALGLQGAMKAKLQDRFVSFFKRELITFMCHMASKYNEGRVCVIQLLLEVMKNASSKRDVTEGDVLEYCKLLGGNKVAKYLKNDWVAPYFDVLCQECQVLNTL